MIELLLEAERALSFGLVDRAEHLYRQVADADPHNSIAVVGLARVALERGDDPGAYLLACRALTIDPENDAAKRLATRMEEVLATRGEPVVDPMPVVPSAAPIPESRPATTASPTSPASPALAASPPRPTAPASAASPASKPEPGRSLLDRLRRR